MDHIVQTRPGPELDDLVRVWPNASGLGERWHHRARFLAGRNRTDTSFPLSDSVLFFHRKTSQDPFYFWLTVSGFGQTDLVQKQAIVQESSGPFLANASQPIRTGCESDLACYIIIIMIQAVILLL